MGITNSNKVLSTDRISCGETFKVTLSLTAEPSIVSNPVRCGSYSGPLPEHVRNTFR